MPKVLPEKLTVDSAMCYAEESKWAYIRVESENQLAFAKGAGGCPSVFLTNETETWIR